MNEINGNARRCAYAFGEFELDPARRIVSKSGVDLKLKPKTIDVLLALVESAGDVVSKTELLDRVWGDSFVEEKNLSVHIATLRKVFGESKNENRFIATVPGTGYSFVAEVERHDATSRAAASPAARTHQNADLPRRAVIVTAVLIGAVVLSALAFWKSRHTPVGATTSPASVKQLTSNGHVESATISPDGRLFAYVTRENENRRLDLGFTAGGKHVTLIEPGNSVISDPVFSPDGSYVYVGIEDAQKKLSICRVPVSSGPIEKVLDGYFAFKLTPDGREIYFGRRDKDGAVDSVIAKDLSSGAERQLASFPIDAGADVNGASLSYDGQRIAAAIRNQRQPIVHDLAVMEIGATEYRRFESNQFREIARLTWADERKVLIAGERPGSYSSVPHRQIFKLDTETGITEP